MPTTTTTQTLTIRLRNPDRLRDQIALLKETLADIRSVNLNNTPVQWHTKLRWEDQLSRVVDFLQHLVPPDLPMAETKE